MTHYTPNHFHCFYGLILNSAHLQSLGSVSSRWSSSASVVLKQASLSNPETAAVVRSFMYQSRAVLQLGAHRPILTAK